MSVALSQSQSSKKSITRALPWAGMGLCLAVLLGHVAYDVLCTCAGARGGQCPEPADGAKDRAGAHGQPHDRVDARRPSSRRPRSRSSRRGSTEIATGVAVVGVIQANSDRQVEVRPRAAGIVREVHVVLGQKVKRGDPLVTLDSPEIGTARLNLRARQRELSTARFEAALEIGNRRQCRPADSRAAQGNQRAPQELGRRRGTHR